MMTLSQRTWKEQDPKDARPRCQGCGCTETLNDQDMCRDCWKEYLAIIAEREQHQKRYPGNYMDW